MAKRKRLDTTPLSPEAAVIEAIRAPLPPIAGVAGEAAMEAAASEVFDEMEAARREGRMVVRLALSDIDMGHLWRDRLAPPPGDEDMAALIASIRAHGQRTPIEVVEIAPGRYGLISGWRRMTALRDIGGAGAEVLAILRAPEDRAEAYVSMVEENEIRAGLSYFERARVAQASAAAGAFESAEAAVDALFAAGSKAKRSKIRAFLPVVAALEAHLAHPTHLTERLGLRLSQALREAGADAIIACLANLPPDRDAAAEAAALDQCLTPRGQAKGEAKTATRGADPVVPGLEMSLSGRGRARKLTLSGPGVDADLAEDITEFLRQRRAE